MGTGGFDAILVLLLLRFGQVLTLAGTVRSKNAAAAAVRGLLDLGVIVLALWAVGAAFDPRDTLVAGHPVFMPANVFGVGGVQGLRAWGPGVLIATAAVLGATAERTRGTPTMLLAAIVGGGLLPYAVEWLVFSGDTTTIVAQAVSLGGVIGGVAGLVLARQAGPRQGKFNRDLSANLMPGHQTVLQVAGLLAVAAGLAPAGGVGLLLGFATAVLAAAAYGRRRFGVVDVQLTLAGGLAGVIAAVASAGVPAVGRVFVGEGGTVAVLAGGAAGVLTPLLVVRTESRWRIDDVGGAAAAALVGGLVGPLVGFLTQWPASFARSGAAGARTAGVSAATAVLAGGVAWLIGRTCARRHRLRVTESTEFDGLDLAEHDVNAYPDFQQSMIKSHHLRQL